MKRPPEHGERARYLQHRREDEQPCAACQAAHARWCKQYKVDRQQGRSRQIPPVRAAVHLVWLSQHGVRMSDVVKLTGLSPCTLRLVRRCERPLISRRTHRLILAVTPARAGLVEPRVTAAQVGALMAAGWSRRWIAGQVGCSYATVERAGRGGRIRRGTARRIAELAVRVGDQPGPSAHARRAARALGRLPAAWHDDNWQPLVYLPAGPKRRALTLLDSGLPVEKVAAETRLSSRTIQRMLEVAG